MHLEKLQNSLDKRKNCIPSKQSFAYHQADSFLYTPMVWWDTTRQCRVDDIHAKAWWYTKPVGLDKKTLVQKNEGFLVAEAGLSSPAIEQSTGLFSQSLCSFYPQTLEVVSSPTKTKRNPETNLKVSFGILALLFKKEQGGNRGLSLFFLIISILFN